MNRPLTPPLTIALVGLLFAAVLLFIDRTVAGFVQCDAARACPGDRP